MWFAALLNLKYIYLYVAPAYAIFLLRDCCFIRHTGWAKLCDTTLHFCL